MARNALMIVADDWSPIARCYGDADAPTPYVDTFAERAVVFDRAFCTTPSCAASRASLLTGLHSHQHGQYGHSHGVHGFGTRKDVTTLPALCHAHNLWAQLIGKHHTAPDERYPWDVRKWPETPTPDAWRASIAEAFARPGSGFVMAATSYPHRGGPDGWLTHDHVDAFGDAPHNPASLTVPPFLPDIPEVRADLAGYRRAVGRFDACVGAILEAIADHPDADETLVMILSDHGMPFPGAKASFYDTGHHCPLLIGQGLSGLPGQARRATPVTWLDLWPTIVDWLGLGEPEDRIDRTGRSLLSDLVPDAVDTPRTVFASHSFHEVTMYDPYRFAHDGRWKYVQQLNHHAPLPLASDLFDSPTWLAVRQRDLDELGERRRIDYEARVSDLLFDTQADPFETTNLIEREPERADRMRRSLIDHRKATEDPWLKLDYQRAHNGR